MAGSVNLGGRPHTPLSTQQKIKRLLMDNLIIILMIIAMILGVGLGLGLRTVEGWEFYQKRKIFYLQFPGDLLLNMLKMLIIPLVVSSIVSSLASLSATASGTYFVKES